MEMYLPNDLLDLDNSLRHFRYEVCDMRAYKETALIFLLLSELDINEVLKTKTVFGKKEFCYPAVIEMMADLDCLGRFTSYFYEIAKFVLETNYFQDELLYSQGKKGDKNSPYLIELIAKHKSFYLLSDESIMKVINIANKLPGSKAYYHFYSKLKAKYENIRFEVVEYGNALSREFEIVDLNKSIKDDINDILFCGHDMEKDGDDLRYLLLRYGKKALSGLSRKEIYDEIISSFFDDEGEYSNFIEKHFMKISKVLYENYNYDIDFASDLEDKKDEIIRVIMASSNEETKERDEETIGYVEFLTDLLMKRKINYSMVNF